MGMLVDFLKFCIDKEKDNRILPIQTHNNFQKFIDKYNGENLRDDRYKELLDAVKETHNAILNKTDESAMDYIEKGYSTAKSLVLSNKENKGYNLTEDDESVTKLNSAAFITTAIVLQATLVLGLIISLLALVK